MTNFEESPEKRKKRGVWLGMAWVFLIAGAPITLPVYCIMKALQTYHRHQHYRRGRLPRQ